VTFSVSYVVREASWRSTYDVALDSQSAAQKLDVNLVGEVQQRTGEDWTGTALVLSTERPAFLAVPVPVRQDYRRDYRTRKAMAIPMAADGMSSAAPAAAPEPVDEPIPYENAATTKGEFATRYKVAQAVTIKTGADFRRVALIASTLLCHAAVVIVPSGAPTAVLEASTMYQGDLPLIPGPAQLYHDGEFVGTGNIGTVMPGEELRVAFGTDPAVRITRKTLNNGRAEGWFDWFGSVSRVYRWETTLKSGHAAPWTVEVHEQIPQSDDPDVRIVPGTLSAGLMEDDPEKPGLKRWQVALEPGKSQKIVFEYVIRSKKGKPVPRFS